jgi:hypothetical protein
MNIKARRCFPASCPHGHLRPSSQYHHCRIRQRIPAWHKPSHVSTESGSTIGARNTRRNDPAYRRSDLSFGPQNDTCLTTSLLQLLPTELPVKRRMYNLFSASNKLLPLLLLPSVIGLSVADVNAQNNAAPSMHLTYYFDSDDAVLKMQKINIAQSADASYFEVNHFTNGYTGLQQTPDKAHGPPYILLSSLWDVNTAKRVYSTVEYTHRTTVKSRFGGEGNGWKTITPYKWQLNTWYTIVNRGWKADGKLYIATFINDTATGEWVHTATLSLADPGHYLGATNDAFLENWDGSTAASSGKHIRKAFLKDCWNLNVDGEWEKNTSAYFSANDSEADKRRNGIYHTRFDAFYDSTENAYCLQHGGSTTPSAAFEGGRTLRLSAQAKQGSKPTLSSPVITAAEARFTRKALLVNWAIDEFKSPQLSVKVEVIDATGSVVLTKQDTLPQRRTIAVAHHLVQGEYTARLTVTDIFNQYSKPVFITLSKASKKARPSN